MASASKQQRPRDAGRYGLNAEDYPSYILPASCASHGGLTTKSSDQVAARMLLVLATVGAPLLVIKLANNITQ